MLEDSSRHKAHFEWSRVACAGPLMCMRMCVSHRALGETTMNETRNGHEIQMQELK